MNHFSALSALVDQIHIPPDMAAKFRQLRAGVDFTQNQADRSLNAETWTAARDAAVAFEQLERALARLEDACIPF
jgi:hypothetical protein